jgi:hypothetical protein
MRWFLPTAICIIFASTLQAEPTPAKPEVEVSVDLADYPRLVRVHISNTSKQQLKLQHPGNRRAISFFISDHLGNTVAPVGRAKVDPPTLEITIAAGQRYTHELTDFEYLTGSALFGFDLKPASDYRVIAVYRPQKDAPGIASAEKAFSTP